MQHPLFLSVFLFACSKQTPVVQLDTIDTATDSTTPTVSTTPSNLGPAGLMASIIEVPRLPEFETMLSFTGKASSNHDLPIDVRWFSDWDGDLFTETVPGPSDLQLETDTLSLGPHVLTLELTQGEEAHHTEWPIGVCRWPVLETFDYSASLAGWTLFGNAYWDPQGWLEITGNVSSSQGAIYKTDRTVNAGDVAIEFSIATGGGINTGADGFSVNVINAADVAELSTIVNTASNGGCLGAYSDGGSCGSTPINAFHIEFDTWYNSEYDPAHQDNHVAIAINGNPTPLLEVQVTSLEDLQWRDIRVEISGSTVTVFIDGGQVIIGDIPGWTFDGGYIGVSGSTGWATNWHRFDNLQLLDMCEVPARASSTTATTPP
jgi:hypothetical protein